MIPQFNYIILDIAVVLLLILIAVFGALKGIKHVSIDLAILIGSILLSFSSLTNFIKLPLIKLLFSTMLLGAGANDVAKLSLSLSYFLFVSLLLMLVLYLLGMVIKYLVRFFVKRSYLKNNKLLKTPSTLERVFGGIANFIFGGIFIIMILSVGNSPLIGLDKTINESMVTKHVIKLDNLVFSSDELYEAKFNMKILKGDLFFKVKEENAKSMENLVSIVEKGSFKIKDLSEMQTGLDAIYNILLFVDMNCLNDEGKAFAGYEQAVELTKNVVTAAINNMNDLREGNDPIQGMKNIQAISNLLIQFGLDDINEIFISMFVNS